MADAATKKAQEQADPHENELNEALAGEPNTWRRPMPVDVAPKDREAEAIAYLEAHGVSHQDAVSQVSRDGAAAVMARAVAPKKAPLRARFIVTEIAKSVDGSFKVTFKADYDHTIDPKRSIIPGNNPKGTLELEVSPEAAVEIAHGSAFNLVQVG